MVAGSLGLSRLLRHTEDLLQVTTDSAQRTCLESARELFNKLQAGNAQQGWVALKAGTEVHDIRVVRPRWYHSAWAALAGLWRRT